MALIVQKFGGSSVKDRNRIFNVARIVANTHKAGNDVVVVVSAQGDTTDDLIAKAAEITHNPSAREMDMLLAAGEEISIALLAMALNELGCHATSLTGWQAGFRTDRAYTKARITRMETERISSELERNRVVVVAGFQGLNKLDDIKAEAVWVYGMGQGSAADAADLIEYLNAPADGDVTNPNGGVDWAEVRAANGHPEPYGVTRFEIGNEIGYYRQTYWMDGRGNTDWMDAYIDGGRMTFGQNTRTVKDEDWRDQATNSDGTANQVRYVRYTPAVENSVAVYVGEHSGRSWIPWKARGHRMSAR